VTARSDWFSGARTASGPEGCQRGSGNEDPVQGEQVPVCVQASQGFGVSPWGRHPERNGTSGRSHPSRTEPVSGPGDPKASNPFDRFGPKVTPLSGHDRRDDRPPGGRSVPAGPCLWRASFPPEGGPSTAHRSAARGRLHAGGRKRRRASLASP
jgi:hypothetical protein